MPDLPDEMKAVFFTNYGSIDQLEVISVPVPTIDNDEVLIRNHASSINFGNYAHITGVPFLVRAFTGFFGTKFNTPGGDISGEIIKVGDSVTDFEVGDLVIGDTGDSGMGAYAEFVKANPNIIVKKPEKLSFEQAATFPMAAGTALTAIELASIKKGDDVLIIGGTGSVGPYAIQITKSIGANVTVVCNGEKADYARKAGADKIIDYKKEDFIKLEDKYDVILGVSGSRSMFDYKKALRPEGTYVNVGGSMNQIINTAFLGSLLSAFSKQKFKMFTYSANKETLKKILNLINNESLKPMIDKEFNLDKIVDAFKYYESRKASGKIIIKI